MVAGIKPADTSAPVRRADGARMSERTLFTVERTANGHSHTLTIVEVAFPDCAEVYVVLSEPDKCGCARRLPLSEVAHLVLNVTEREMLEIPNRSADQAGHAHG